MISISIDVTLLDKARFKRVTRRDGTEAVFCELIAIDTPAGKFGDYMVKQEVSKEERAQRVEMPILGNGKTIGKKAEPRQRDAAEEPERRRRDEPETRRQRTDDSPRRAPAPPVDPDLDAPEDDIPW